MSSINQGRQNAQGGSCLRFRSTLRCYFCFDLVKGYILNRLIRHNLGDVSEPPWRRDGGGEKQMASKISTVHPGERLAGRPSSSLIRHLGEILSHSPVCLSCSRFQRYRESHQRKFCSFLSVPDLRSMLSKPIWMTAIDAVSESTFGALAWRWMF